VDLRKLRREASHNIHFTRPTEFSLIIRWLNLGPRNSICDIGCGDGYWTSRLAGANRRLFGVDADSEVLTRAQYYYGQFANFVLASAENLPFENNTMDRVVSLCAMEHFTDDRQALTEMCRILRPKGRLCMSLDSLSLASISTNYKALHVRRYDVHTLYTHTSIKPLLEGAGFRLLTYTYVGTSRISSWLIQFQIRRGWNVNYLAPITLPVSKLADAISRRTDAGHILIIAAEKDE
jgi:SAM-dependent methyltransferase